MSRRSPGGCAAVRTARIGSVRAGTACCRRVPTGAAGSCCMRTSRRGGVRSVRCGTMARAGSIGCRTVRGSAAGRCTMRGASTGGPGGMCSRFGGRRRLGCCSRRFLAFCKCGSQPGSCGEQRNQQGGSSKAFDFSREVHCHRCSSFRFEARCPLRTHERVTPHPSLSRLSMSLSCLCKREFPLPPLSRLSGAVPGLRLPGLLIGREKLLQVQYP